MGWRRCGDHTLEQVRRAYRDTKFKAVRTPEETT